MFLSYSVIAVGFLVASAIYLGRRIEGVRFNRKSPGRLYSAILCLIIAMLLFCFSYYEYSNIKTAQFGSKSEEQVLKSDANSSEQGSGDNATTSPDI